MASVADTSLFALNIATGLSLGLAVDYALLLVSRHREETAALGFTEEAHRRTVRTAGRAALFSGLTVAGAMAAHVVMPQRFLYSVGVAGAMVGVLSALMAIFVVPALLRVLGPRINAPCQTPRRTRSGRSVPSSCRESLTCSWRATPQDSSTRRPAWWPTRPSRSA